MKKNNLLIVVSILVILSCKTIHCPDFPKELEGYLPYIQNRELQFYNEQGDTILFILDSVGVSLSSDYKSNCPCECFTQKIINTNKDTAFDIEINPQLIVYGEQNEEINFSFYINSDYGVIEKNNMKYSQSKAPLGDTVFFEKCYGNNFSKVTVVYKKGLVSFYDNRYSCTWKLVE